MKNFIKILLISGTIVLIAMIVLWLNSISWNISAFFGGKNETSQFLGDESGWNNVKILYNWDGMSGLSVSGNGSVELASAESVPGEPEYIGPNKVGTELGRNYKVQRIVLSQSDIEKLIRVFINNNFAKIPSEERSMLPGGAYGGETIILINRDGATYTANRSKFINGFVILGMPIRIKSVDRKWANLLISLDAVKNIVSKSKDSQTIFIANSGGSDDSNPNVNKVIAFSNLFRQKVANNPIYDLSFIDIFSLEKAVEETKSAKIYMKWWDLVRAKTQENFSARKSELLEAINSIL